MNKNMSFRNKLFSCFVAIDVLFAVMLLFNYQSVKKVVNLDPDRMDSYLRGYGVYSICAFIFVVLFMTGISVYVLRTLRLNLTGIKEASSKIAEGNDFAEIPVEVKDEFGEVVEEFNNMIRSNRRQSELMNSIANGDLTMEVNPRSTDDIVGKALKQLVEKNRETLATIRDGAFQVDTAASEVASAAEALAQGSTEQASAIEEINASIYDVAKKTKANAKDADNAVEIMNRAIADMHKGNKQMEDMVEAMNDINVSSQNISKIIKVIDDIAFQTNILALNAAVEAARAGDAGMGFAVVAEEVRNLAAKSAEAASETAEMIENSIKKIRDGKDIADDTMKSIEAISIDVSETAEIIKGIATASNYQATAIDQIDQAVNQVSQVVSTNSATSEQCAAASMELSGQAKSIRDSLTIYKLGMNDGVVRSNYSGNYSTVNATNEKIISLSDGFGKY